MNGPLHGIRVVDFGRYIAGPFCAALLGDLGAEVIRVEKRDGREDRTLISLGENADGSPREGAMFLQMNRNKRGLTLDPAHEKGRDVVRRLIAKADVVIANLPGETLKSLGLDYASVSAINPRAVLGVATAFGLEGPYSNRVGFDGIAQAMKLPYIDVAAKTGTAQVGAHNEYINSWVVGFFPYEHPKYAFAVVLEKGPSTTTVGAAPAFGQFLIWMREHEPQYLGLASTTAAQ